MADKEEVWMNWGGGSPPVSGSTCVDIKLRAGHQFSGSASAFYWAHDQDDSDIMEWRPRMADENNIVDRMRGRADYIRNGGGIKSAELLEGGIKEIERLRQVLTTIIVNIDANPAIAVSGLRTYVNEQLNQ